MLVTVSFVSKVEKYVGMTRILDQPPLLGLNECTLSTVSKARQNAHSLKKERQYQKKSDGLPIPCPK